MTNEIHDPLTEYIQTFRERFKNIAETTFTNLAEEAHVDIAANQATCKKIYANEQKASSIKSKRIGYTVICVILWIIALFCVVVAASYIQYWEFTETTNKIVVFGAIIAIILIQFTLIHPAIKRLKEAHKKLTNIVQTHKKEAWEQMEPLNRLYDWDILTRMMCKTVPKLEFDPYFTTQRLEDLKATYGWDDSFNENRSVICSHSGLINGNPFVLCRTRKMEWGAKTYYGHKTIHWTTSERGSDGHYHTVHHSETLTASVTAPFPEYYEKTRLIYGNTAAPDLIFNRKQSGLAENIGGIAYKLKRRKLRKKARDLKNSNFAMMSNEEFEVIFNTSNRNHNQQHALLFTPLAQESMIKLLQDESAGYGDDFDFEKNKMINIIVAEHMQGLNIDLNPTQYRNFDFYRAKSDFVTINAEYFRAIYFNLAPLLCIPMYQQIRPHHDIYGIDMKKRSSFWEHEAQANLWGQRKFMHPQCVTDCILKTEVSKQEGEDSVITVYAHGYRSEERVSYKSVYGGDGRYHSVAVYWDEYFPITGTGNMYIKEDNNTKESFSTQTQRIDYIREFMSKSDFTEYRRNIASKI